MPYQKCKIYNDGSHFIAIPHTTRPAAPKRYHPEEVIEVVDDTPQQQQLNTDKCNAETALTALNDTNKVDSGECSEQSESPPTYEISKPTTTRKITRRQLFDELYEECKSLKKSERKKYIYYRMKKYFANSEAAKQYVDCQFDRLKRNAIAKRVRLVRKVNLQTFNHFCTFTYDGKKHTEESFRKKLSDTFKKMCYRRKWKYVGVWERSPDKKRLHFHGLFYIPPDAMVGELVEVKDYSPVKEKVQTTYQNAYFNERFGRSDFKEVNEHVLSEAVRYIMKYLEKDGGRIVYSKGLPQYFISDIMDDDVACTIGQEDKKLLLFDNFNCWDEGCLVGQVSKEVIDQMPKAN